MAEQACAACSLKNSHSASKRELNYAEGVSYRLVHFAVWLASAALCFGTSIERNPIKKKGAGPLFQIHYGDKWGFMDRTGKTVIQPQFSDVGDFFAGLARVVVRVGKDLAPVWPDSDGGGFVYIDRNGKKVVKPQGGRWAFSDGLTVAGEYGKRVYVDRKGKTVAPYEVNPGY